MEKVGDNCLLQKLNILYNLYAKERWDKKIVSTKNKSVFACFLHNLLKVLFCRYHINTKCQYIQSQVSRAKELRYLLFVQIFMDAIYFWPIPMQTVINCRNTQTHTICPIVILHFIIIIVYFIIFVCNQSKFFIAYRLFCGTPREFPDSREISRST